MLTFDDGYIDNYIFALPISEKNGVQGSFFIPGKTFTTHQLFDVKECMEFYRGQEVEYAPIEELWNEYAAGN